MRGAVTPFSPHANLFSHNRKYALLEACALTRLGKAYHELGVYTLALEHLKKAASILEEHCDKNTETHNLINLAEVHTSMFLMCTRVCMRVCM